MKHKTIVLSIFFSAILMLFWNCGGYDKNQVTLTVLGENSSNLQAMESLKGDYEKKAGVKIDFKPNTFEDAFNKANQDFANKTGLYDIVLQYNFSLSSFVRNNYVYSLDELTKNIPADQLSFENDLFPNAWQEVGYYYKNPSNPSEGITKVGYPFAANTLVLVYNQSLLNDPAQQAAYKKKYNEDLAVPADWDHFKRIAEFFTQNDTQKGKKNYGVCLQGAAGGWLYYEFSNFLFGMGGSVMQKERGWQSDVNTPITLTSPEAVAAANYYISLKPFNAGNFTTVDATEQTKILKEGNVALALVWSDYLYNFVYDNAGNADTRFGFAPIPGNKSALAGGSFYINRQSKHPEEAIKYVIDLMQKPNQVALTKKGLISPLKSTYDDPEVQKIPYANAIKTSLERGVYMFEAGPESDLVSQTITNYMQQFWEGRLSAEDALRRAKEDIERGRADIYKNLK
jgi:multiple sugar transport system substrate-binding protein